MIVSIIATASCFILPPVARIERSEIRDQPMQVATPSRRSLRSIRATGYSVRATNAPYSFAFNCASFAAMKARISSAMSSSFTHCSLYSVTGNRPMP
jgi:hypothetical protein